MKSKWPKAVVVPRRLSPRERFLEKVAGDLIAYANWTKEKAEDGDAWAYYGLSLAFWGRVEEAREALRRAIPLRIRAKEAYIAECFEKGGKEYSPGNATNYIGLARLAAHLGDEGEAQRLFRQARTHLDAMAGFSPEDLLGKESSYFDDTADILLQLAYVMLRMGELRGARTYVIPATAEEILAQSHLRKPFRNAGGGAFERFREIGYTPTLAETDVFGVLRTAETVLKVHKTWDSTLFYASDNLALVAALLPMAGYLLDPAREDLRKEIRPALLRYYHTAPRGYTRPGLDFVSVFSTVLDLQRAFREVIGEPVIPDPFEMGKAYQVPPWPEIEREAILKAREIPSRDEVPSMVDLSLAAYKEAQKQAQDQAGALDPPAVPPEGLFKQIVRALLRQGEEEMRSKRD